MNKNKINEIFGQIETLLKQLREAYEVKNKKTLVPEINIATKTHKSKKGIGPAKALSELLVQGFFNIYKTPAEACKELTKRALNVDKDVMSLALMRLVRRGKMERDGAGTIKDPWKYKSK